MGSAFFTIPFRMTSHRFGKQSLEAEKERAFRLYVKNSANVENFRPT